MRVDDSLGFRCEQDCRVLSVVADRLPTRLRVPVQIARRDGLAAILVLEATVRKRARPFFKCMCTRLRTRHQTHINISHNTVLA